MKLYQITLLLALFGLGFIISYEFFVYHPDPGFVNVYDDQEEIPFDESTKEQYKSDLDASIESITKPLEVETKGISVEPVPGKSYIFWEEAEENSKPISLILQSNNRKTILKNKVFNPSLTMIDDTVAKQLFHLVDGYSKTIKQASRNMSKVKVDDIQKLVDSGFPEFDPKQLAEEKDRIHFNEMIGKVNLVTLQLRLGGDLMNTHGVTMIRGKLYCAENKFLPNYASLREDFIEVLGDYCDVFMGHSLNLGLISASQFQDYIQ